MRGDSVRCFVSMESVEPLGLHNSLRGVIRKDAVEVKRNPQIGVFVVLRVVRGKNLASGKVSGCRFLHVYRIGR